MTAEWVVVIEGTGASAISISTVRGLMELMALGNPTTLHTPNRYALQVVVPAPTADDALARALKAWRDAQKKLRVDPWELARAEVITRAEFEWDMAKLSRRPTSAGGGLSEDLDDVLLGEIFHDEVTGLANRELFIDHLHHELRRLKRVGGDLTLAVFELPPFLSSDGDPDGEFGRYLLRTVAERLTLAARREDSVGRIGENQFALLINGVPEETGEAIARRVLHALRDPHVIGRRDVELPVELGVATSASTDDAESLILLAQARIHDGDQEGVLPRHPSRPEAAP